MSFDRDYDLIPMLANGYCVADDILEYKVLRLMPDCQQNMYSVN